MEVCHITPREEISILSLYQMDQPFRSLLTTRVRVGFLQRAWRPQGIATTIYACCSFCVYSSDDPCGRHAKISRSPLTV
jgi:hypothetical protein